MMEPKNRIAVHIEPSADGQWTAKIPALADLEYSSKVGPEDALNGILIEAFRCLADRMEGDQDVPTVVESWFSVSWPERSQS